MQFTDKQKVFLDRHHGAAMTSLRQDGAPHTVRVGFSLVDGRLWSSGTAGRERTAHLRRDPRASVMVFDSAWSYLTVEATVTMIDGAEAAESSLSLFRVMQNRGSTFQTLLWEGKEKTADDFLRIMQEERRLIYQFDPVKVYGLY